MTTRFDRSLAAARAAVAAVLRRESFGVLVSRELAQAMDEALLGGKGLRAWLVLETAALAGADAATAARVGAAIECAHAYSLVHDDLPCMDDAATRRGRPALHLARGEAAAVLAGDALQTQAFTIVLDEATCADPKVRVSVGLALARALGADGMAGGQARELLGAPATTTSASEHETIHRHKTAVLMACAASMGARLVGGDPDPGARFGEAFGLAFQLADDIGDKDGWARALGARQAEARLGEAVASARAALAVLDPEGRTTLADVLDAPLVFAPI